MKSQGYAHDSYVAIECGKMMFGLVGNDKTKDGKGTDNRYRWLLLSHPVHQRACKDLVTWVDVQCYLRAMADLMCQSVIINAQDACAPTAMWYMWSGQPKHGEGGVILEPCQPVADIACLITRLDTLLHNAPAARSDWAEKQVLRLIDVLFRQHIANCAEYRRNLVVHAQAKINATAVPQETLAAFGVTTAGMRPPRLLTTMTEPFHVNSSHTFSIQFHLCSQAIETQKLIDYDAGNEGGGSAGSPTAASAGAPAAKRAPSPNAGGKLVPAIFNAANPVSGVNAKLKGFFHREKPKKYPHVPANECLLALLLHNGCANPDCDREHANGKSSQEQKAQYKAIKKDYDAYQLAKDKPKVVWDDDAGGKGKGNGYGNKGKGKWQDSRDWYRSSSPDERYHDDRRPDNRRADDRRSDDRHFDDHRREDEYRRRQDDWRQGNGGKGGKGNGGKG